MSPPTGNSAPAADAPPATPAEAAATPAPNTAGGGAFRLDAWVAAVILLLAALHLLSALAAAAASSGPRVFESALLAGVIQLLAGGLIAYAVAWCTARLLRGPRGLTSAVFCATLAGTQAFALRGAFARGDSSRAVQIVTEALEPRGGPANANGPGPRPAAGSANEAGLPPVPAPAESTLSDLGRVLAVLDAALVAAGGDERFMIAATRAAVEQLEPAQRRHAQAYAALRAAGGIDLASLRTPEDIQQRLDLLEGLVRAGELLEAELRRLPSALEQQLETRFRHDDVQRFLSEFRSAARLDAQLALHAAEAGFCKESRRLLTMLWRAWGQWQVPSPHARRPTFNDPQLAGDFDRVMTRILKHVVEQARIRAELDQPPPAPAAP